MSPLMSKNISATEAILAIHLVDTDVWWQTCHLPLKLDKTSKFIGKVQKIAKPDAKSPSHIGNSCTWS